MSLYNFNDFQLVLEMIKKRGNHWVVLNKKGTKVLGTHSSKEKALKQLRAIEISKASHIYENSNREWDKYELSSLKKCPFLDKFITDKVTEIYKVLENLENNYNYTKLLKHRYKYHYTFNIKIYVQPDLKKWSEITGFPENEEVMMDSWFKFLDETFSIEKDDILENYQWVDDVYRAGNNAGWLCIVPKSSHEFIAKSIEDIIQSYEIELDVIGNEEISVYNMWLEDITSFDLIPDLQSVGLVDFTDLIQLKENLNEFDQFLKILKDREQDLMKIKESINEFKSKALEYFYDGWL